MTGQSGGTPPRAPPCPPAFSWCPGPRRHYQPPQPSAPLANRLGVRPRKPIPLTPPCPVPPSAPCLIPPHPVQPLFTLPQFSLLPISSHENFSTIKPTASPSLTRDLALLGLSKHVKSRLSLPPPLSSSRPVSQTWLCTHSARDPIKRRVRFGRPGAAAGRRWET